MNKIKNVKVHKRYVSLATKDEQMINHYGHLLDTIETMNGPYVAYCTECQEFIADIATLSRPKQ